MEYGLCVVYDSIHILIQPLILRNSVRTQSSQKISLWSHLWSPTRKSSWALVIYILFVNDNILHRIKSFQTECFTDEDLKTVQTTKSLWQIRTRRSPFIFDYFLHTSQHTSVSFLWIWVLSIQRVWTHLSFFHVWISFYSTRDILWHSQDTVCFEWSGSARGRLYGVQTLSVWAVGTSSANRRILHKTNQLLALEV